MSEPVFEVAGKGQGTIRTSNWTLVYSGEVSAKYDSETKTLVLVWRDKQKGGSILDKFQKLPPQLLKNGAEEAGV